jgi:hypothetical protein
LIVVWGRRRRIATFSDGCDPPGFAFGTALRYRDVEGAVEVEFVASGALLIVIREIALL